MKLPSPITWIGGKSRLLSHLLPLLQPAQGENCYVEPFGGSGVVMMNKVPHASETYNDMDGELINLFRTIRDPDGVVHLWWELINTPYSRLEFGEAIDETKRFSPENPVKRAARFVISCRQRFGGGQPGTRRDTDRSWGLTFESGRGMNDCVSRWLSTMLHLPAIHQRMSTVVIDNQDAIRCVKQWDSPATLFYCDPPYVGAEQYYKGGFGPNQHKALAEALNSAQGRVVLSYYAHPAVEQLYPAERWRKLEIKTRTTACGNKRRTAGKAGVKAQTGRTEWILVNFDPRTRKRTPYL